MKDFKKPVGKDYESPQTLIMEMYSEGVLCSSTEDFTEDEPWELV